MRESFALVITFRSLQCFIAFRAQDPCKPLLGLLAGKRVSTLPHVNVFPHGMVLAETHSAHDADTNGLRLHAGLSTGLTLHNQTPFPPIADRLCSPPESATGAEWTAVGLYPAAFQCAFRVRPSPAHTAKASFATFLHPVLARGARGLQDRKKAEPPGCRPGSSAASRAERSTALLSLPQGSQRRTRGIWKHPRHVNCWLAEVRLRLG